MSEGGKTSKPGADTLSTEAPDQELTLPEDFRSRDPAKAFGAARFDGIRAERQAATAQIQRSLKAWRASNGGASTVRTKIPSGGGAPLSGSVRARMEPKLNADLSAVRVHTDGESSEAAKDLGARAFTVGSDVHFHAGEFQPGSKEGDKLLAHELTHVVQGQKSGVQRKAEDGAEAKEGGEEVSDPAEPAEKEADAVGGAVADELHGDKKEDAAAKGGGGGGDDGQKVDVGAAAQEVDAEKEKKPGEKKKNKVKEAAPDIGAKLMRKIYRGGGDKKQQLKGITYSGRNITVVNGKAYYQSSGQANQLGGIQKPVGAWFQIWGCQEKADNIGGQAIPEGWIMKQTLTQPDLVGGPPMDGYEIKYEGEKATPQEVNAWLAAQGVSPVYKSLRDTKK